jgi:hypothetical protein
LRDLPDLGHFKVVQGKLDISRIQVWSNGAIELIALLYRVCFRVEHMSGEFNEYSYQNITPGHTEEVDPI